MYLSGVQITGRMMQGLKRLIAEQRDMTAAAEGLSFSELRELRTALRERYDHAKQFEGPEWQRIATDAANELLTVEGIYDRRMRKKQYGTPEIQATETDPLLIEEGGKWKWKGTPSELAAVVYVAPCDYPPEQDYSNRTQYFRAYVDFDNWKAVVEVCKRLKQGRTPSLPKPRVERLCRMLTDIIGR